ncbi:unnamed protein product [Urochloa humidicola]
MALRHLKALLGAFEQIDAAIEAAGCSRAELRSVRACIVEMVCEATDDSGRKVEGLCALLDEAMEAVLATLREVPVEKIALKPGDLVSAIDALMSGSAGSPVTSHASGGLGSWPNSSGPGPWAAMVLDGILATPPLLIPKDDTAPMAGSNMKA